MSQVNYEQKHDGQTERVVSGSSDLGDFNPAENLKNDLDRLCRLAARLTNCSAALIILLEEDSHRVLGESVEGNREFKWSGEFARLVWQKQIDGVLVQHPGNDAVAAQTRIGSQKVRFEAGTRTSGDNRIRGVLCVFDDRPHDDFGTDVQEELVELAKLANSIIAMNISNGEGQISKNEAKRDALRHEMILETAGVASWVMNTKTGVVEADPNLGELLDFPEGEHFTFENTMQCVHPDDAPRLESRIEKALAENGDYECEFRTVGSGRWLMARGYAHEPDENGFPTYLVGVVIDVSENRRSAENTKLLLRELNHRVKNTLAILQAMAVQSLRRSKTTAEFTAAFSGRLQAISAAHGLLSDSDWTAIKLQTLIEVQTRPYIDRTNPLNIHGINPLIGPDTALGLGLIIHELATNAVRHGALSDDRGEVEVAISDMQINGQKGFCIDWIETGGPCVEEPDQKGFGSILINRGLDKVIGSQIQMKYLTSGMHTIIKVPLHPTG